jgi:hypothetical protein
MLSLKGSPRISRKGTPDSLWVLTPRHISAPADYYPESAGGFLSESRELASAILNWAHVENKTFG